MRELLKELTRMGKTIMISSHILPELSDFCNRIGVIEAGKMVAGGRVDDILASLQAGRHITLKLLKNGEKAAEQLQNDPLVSELVFDDETPAVLNFSYSGELEDLASLSQNYSNPDFGLVGLEETKADLEDIFLQVTEGIVR